MKKRTKLIGAVIFSILIGGIALAQEISNYLITSNIGDYIASTNPTSGAGPGVVVGADHFYHDHADMTYRISYYNLQTKAGPEIQITQHAGSDSDQWLLHEVEDSYRDNDDSDGRIGRLSGAGVKIRDIGGNKFIYWGLGGGSYTWLSGQKVIEIKYTDLQRTKPEPIAVVQAYLQKHPSTILTTFVLDQAHDVQWIKDEMTRRLWLCDKWVLQIQTPDPKLNDKLKSIVDIMTVFLNYREKYWSLSSTNDKNLLSDFLNKKNDTAIKAKLTEYKTWWTAHKNDAITLP